MSKHIWFVSQFSNTPNTPGHNRQFDVCLQLSSKYHVSLYLSSFNLSTRSYLPPDTTLCGERFRVIVVPTTPYRTDNILRVVNYLAFSLFTFSTLFVHALTRPKPRCIIASSPQLYSCLASLLISKIFSIPLILEVRDLWPQILLDSGFTSKSSFTYKHLKFIENVLYSHSTHIIALSHGSASHISTRTDNPVHALPNGPDLSLFRYYPLPQPRNTFRFLYAGAHGYANDLITVVNAARILQQIHPEINITLMGDGPLKTYLQEVSSDLSNVRFLPPQPQRAMPKSISDYDAVVVCLADLPLFRYGVSPNKLYDAYAVGRPIVTNILGDISDEIESHQLGVTCKPGCPRLLAEAMTKLAATNYPERISMSQRCRHLAETKYSRKLVVASFDDIISSL